MTITNEFLNYEGLVVYDNEIRNYIDEKTAYTESDPTVPDHVKNITTGDISNWNSKSNFSGNYDDLTNKPTLGTLAGKSQVEKMDLSADLQTAVDRVDFAAGGTMGGSLTINGNLTVNGTSTTVETYNENVNVEDNTITLRYNATTGLQNSDYTGIVAQNYDGANNGMLVFDNSGTAYVGDSGDLQPLATRAFTDSDDGALAAWDASAKTLIKAPVEVEDIVTKENVDSFNKALSTATGDNDIAYQKDVTVEKASYAEVTKLGGMTYKSKNLIPYPYASAAVTSNGVTIRPNEDGSISIGGDKTATNAIVFHLVHYTLPAGTYHLSGLNTTGGYTTFHIGCDIYDMDGTWVNIVYDIGNGGTITLDRKMRIQIFIRIFESYTGSVNFTAYPMLNEGSTALPYEPYYEGLRSAKVTEVKSVGVNLWDEEWESGYVNLDTGNDGLDSNSSRCKNFISVEPSTNYYIHNGSWGETRIALYDNGKAFIGYITTKQFTTPSNCRYIKFYWSGTEYNHDICINKSDAAINGKYFPYFNHTLPIPEAVQALDGINENVYDYIEWAEDGSVKKTVKCGVVDLGEQQWNKAATSEFYADIDDNIVATWEGYACLCAKYTRAEQPTVVNNGEMVLATKNQSGTAGRLFIVDNNYADVESFKAAVSGVMLVYELAEPIVTNISDLIGDNSIGVQSNGTLTFENEYGYAAPSEVVFYNEKAEAIAADKIVGNLIGLSTRAISDEDGNSIANTYMKKSNALEVISGLTEIQLQKLISLIDTIEIQ